MRLAVCRAKVSGSLLLSSNFELRRSTCTLKRVSGGPSEEGLMLGTQVGFLLRSNEYRAISFDLQAVPPHEAPQAAAEL